MLGTSATGTARLRPRAGAAGVLAVGVAYAVGAELAWHAFGANVGLALFPPAGVTVAALILSDTRRWPAIMLVVFAVEATVDLTQGLPVAIAAGYGLANVAEPLVGAWVLRRLHGPDPELDRRRGLVVFVAAVAGAGPLAGGVIGATVRTYGENKGMWLPNVGHWWAGDGVAVLAVGASIILIARTHLQPRRWIELTITTLAVTAVSGAAMIGVPPAAAVLVPVFVWAALRFGPVGVTTCGGILAITANYLTNAGYGYFADLDLTPASRLTVLQVFIAIMLISVWFVAVEASERQRVTNQRDQMTTTLELVQQTLIPVTAEVPGPFTIGAYYQQASTSRIGGDWFDVFPLPKDRTLFAVGDVVGHGLDAIKDMTQLRYAAQALAVEGHSPVRLLTELSHYTATNTSGGYATIIVAIYDTTRNHYHLAAAGHPPPLIWRAATGRATYLHTTNPGPPLGTYLKSTYDETIVHLNDGDLLVFYTDGLVERPHQVIDIGLTQLQQAVEQWDHTNPDLNTFCAHLTNHCHPHQPPNDDVCLLAIRHTPAT